MADKKQKRDIREALADLCHEQWSGWERYLFRFGTLNDDGTFTMDADKVTRWMLQMVTPYEDLSELEQDSDRKEADKFLRLMLGYGLIEIGRKTS